MKVLVVCRLLGPALRLRLLPLVSLPEVESVVVVRAAPGPALSGVRYVCPPRWLAPRPLAVIAEAILAVVQARRLRPRVVHGIFLVPHGLTALLAARLSRRPSVVAIIGSDLHHHLEQGGALLRRLLVACLRRAGRVTATGPTSAERLTALGVDPGRVDVLPNAVDVAGFEAPPPAQRDLDLLFVGRLVEGKRPLHFVELVDRLRVRLGRVPHAALLGDGPLREAVEHRLAELGLAADVELPGHVADVPRWLGRARLMVLPTVAEGLPYAVVEAMAAGAPPVVSAVGDLPSLLRDGEDGLLIDDFDDLEPVVEAVAALLGDEPSRARMAAAARRRVGETHGLAAAADAWRRILAAAAAADGGR